MRRRLVALTAAVLSALVLTPAGAGALPTSGTDLPVLERHDDGWYFCIRSDVLYGPGGQYCIRVDNP